MGFLKMNISIITAFYILLFFQIVIDGQSETFILYKA